MIRLLIIDDEPRTKRKLSSIISESDLDIIIVGESSNGADGLIQAELLKPDIIITDVRMPQMDGIQLSGKVRKVLPDCQIIFISGYSDKEYLHSAISLKAVSYVEKPFEPDEILSAIQSAIDIIEDNRNKINILKQNQLLHTEQKNLLGEKIALELITPHPREHYLKKLYELYPEFAGHSLFFTLICQLHFTENTERDPLEIFTQIQELMETFCPNALLAHKESNIYILHLCCNAADPSAHVSNLVHHIFSDMKQAFSNLADIFLGVGMPVNEPKLLYQSYTEAVICRKQLFFTGYNNFCIFQKKYNEIGQSFHPEDILFSSFDAALKNDNCKEAAIIIKKLFYEIKNEKYLFEINSIKDVYYRLFLIMDIICRERGIASVFQHDGDFIWENITTKETLFELQDYMLQKMSLYTSAIMDKSGTSVLVTRILQYIEQHYGESDLSINRMAEQMAFTPAYLCQIFKNEYGTTINTYINSFRIKKAIELLKEKDCKLYEVAYKVGYSDQNYFSRHFKKQTGMPPSEFREKYFL